MPDEAPRRFLVATGTTTGLLKSADRLRESVARMTGIFQDTFGYERVTALDLNPSREQMRQELRAFAKKCDNDDLVALYHTGHADMVAGKHRLWMGDTDDPVTDTLVTSELAELMLAETPVRNLLIILDTCFAGQGGTEILMAGLRTAGDFFGKTLLAITSAHPREQVRAGDFARLFERSMDHPATAGYEPRYLSLPAIVSHINQDPQRRAWQTVSYSTVLGTDNPPFLPNPRHNAAFHGFDMATQLQMEQDEQRRQDLEKFFNPRARGVDVPQEAGWNFVGRHAALRELSGWLAGRRDSRSVVVTGDPGSGKSAVIGRLVILSHRDWGQAVPRQGVPEDTIPPRDSIAVAIHARNRTSEEVFQALCAAAHIMAATPGEFLRVRPSKPMVAAIDAIDEAVDPDRLVTAILNPLVEGGPQTGFRLLLGTRAHLLDRLSEQADRIDLDDQRYADPESLRVYAEGRLRAVGGSPYAAADAALVRTVADAVAHAAGRSFLVALITSRTLAALGYLVDPADPLWRESLPGTAAQAMQQDLEARLQDDAARACDLLRPLAYAGGNGLPWEDIWAPLASLLAGREYRDEDLIWLRRNAGSYVVEALESGRSVYRLYHAALAEYLRHGKDERHVHGIFVTYLLRHVPRAATGERAWSEAHPYVLSHLATHAAAADKLANLVSDPCYLACAAPPGLLAAFPTAQDPHTRLVAVVYERALHRLRSNNLAERLSYLEFAARRASAAALAERIAKYPVQRSWSVCWLQWPPDHPHRVLAGHRGPVREVLNIGTADQVPRAVSVGDDGTLRLWNLNTAEQIGVYEVSHAALTAIDLVELPGSRQLAVVLSAAGMLTGYQLPDMSRVMEIPVHSGLRGALGMAQLTACEMSSFQLPDGRWAAVTGGPGLMTTIWDLEARTPIVRLPTGIRPANLALRKLASGALIAVSLDVGRDIEQVFDLATGRRMPDIRVMSRAADPTYYWRRDGTPIISMQRSYDSYDFSGYRQIIDLTRQQGGPPTERWLADGEMITLNDGSQLILVYVRAENSWSFGIRSAEDDEFDPLFPTIYSLDSGGPSVARTAKHAQPSEKFPFRVNLDGRVITLSPIQASDPSREIIVLTGHGADVTDADVVAVNGGPAALLSSSTDGTVRLWDISADAQAAAVRRMVAPSTAVVSISTQPEGNLGVALAATSDEGVAILDLGTGEPVARLACPTGSILAATCGWVPKLGHTAITFEVGGAARIWRLPSGNQVGAFGTHFGAVRTRTDRLPVQAAYLPLPGKPLVVTCGHSNKAIVWDLAERRIHNVFGKHAGLINALACGMALDGTLLAATGGDDNRVNIWNVVKGRRIGHIKIVTRRLYLRQHDSGCAIAVSLVMTGRRRFVVLILCEDGKLRVFRKRRWPLGYQRTTLDTNGASSLAVMHLANRRTVALTGGQDGCLRVWDLEAVLTGAIRGGNDTAVLLDIETEVAITGLSVAGDDTVITSALNGLAAFRLNADRLASQN
jgi:WD40 repeat protein